MTGFSPLTGSDLRLLVSNSPTFATASIYTGTYTAPYFDAMLPTTGGVYFTIGSIDMVSTPLPVELISFEGEKTYSGVKLNWSTITEKNTLEFEVERSIDGYSYNKIGKVPAKGNSISKIDYNFNDPVALFPTYYYRLKIIDMNRAFKYSPVISVNGEGQYVLSDVEVIPNPNNGTFALKLPEQNYSGPYTIKLFDVAGKLMMEQADYITSSKIDQLNIKLEKTLDKGYYYGTCTVNNRDFKFKMAIY